jgi:hypothetical protein
LIVLNAPFLGTYEVLDADGCPLPPPISALQTPDFGLESLETGPEKSENDGFDSVIPLSIVHFDGFNEPGLCRLVLRVTPEAHRWAGRLADHCSLDLSSIIWQSLIRQAEASGFYEKVPTRYVRRAHRNRRHRAVES